MNNEPPPVTAIILNWNGRDDTLVCLNSLQSMNYPSLQLVVVDNASTDDSVPAIRSAFPEATVLVSKRNLGYAGGNNLGITHALRGPASLFLIINNDTRVDHQFLSELVLAADNNPNAGALIPKIFFWDTERIWAAGARWCRIPPRVKLNGFNASDGPDYNQCHDVDYATGCAWLIRRDALQAVGGFDEGYFMYHEDYDFCFRLRAAGYTLHFVPSAHVWHRVSAGLIVHSPQWWYQWSRSIARFYRIGQRFPNHWFLSFASWTALRELLKGNTGFLNPFIRGLLDGWRSLADKN